MNQCRDCGAVFAEDDACWVTLDAYAVEADELDKCCPVCGSDNVGENNACE